MLECIDSLQACFDAMLSGGYIWINFLPQKKIYCAYCQVWNMEWFEQGVKNWEFGKTKFFLKYQLFNILIFCYVQL